MLGGRELVQVVLGIAPDALGLLQNCTDFRFKNLFGCGRPNKRGGDERGKRDSKYLFTRVQCLSKN